MVVKAESYRNLDVLLGLTRVEALQIIWPNLLIMSPSLTL